MPFTRHTLYRFSGVVAGTVLLVLAPDSWAYKLVVAGVMLGLFFIPEFWQLISFVAARSTVSLKNPRFSDDLIESLSVCVSKVDVLEAFKRLCAKSLPDHEIRIVTPDSDMPADYWADLAQPCRFGAVEQLPERVQNYVAVAPDSQFITLHTQAGIEALVLITFEQVLNPAMHEPLQYYWYLFSRYAYLSLQRTRPYDEIKRELQNIESLKRQAEYAQLTRGIAHEIKTPLGNIIQGAWMIKTRHDPDDDANIAELIHQAAVHLDKVTHLMLKYKDAETHDVAPFDIVELVTDIVQLTKKTLQYHHITLAYEGPQTLPVVKANQDFIFQAILNLVNNAISFSDTSQNTTITLALATDTFERENRQVNGVRLDVIDHGAGIAADKLPDVCDPFYTTNAPASDHVGLGLSFASRVFAQNGGKMEIESEEGAGTIVHCFLPV